MEVLAARRGRRGRWLVLALLGLAAAALLAGIVDLATQKPVRGQPHVEGIGDAQQIFGGVRADGDRLGSPDAPVTIQWFDDMQCSNCRQQFLAAIPPGSKRTWRLDLAFPLSPDGHARWEVRFSSMSAIRSHVEREPSDLRFSRERVVPASVFSWP